MRTASFPAIGTLDTTLPTPGDPTYQTEALALTLHQTIKNLSDNSFEFQQSVASDFTAWSTNTQDALDNYIVRYEEILQTGFSAVVANLPDVLPIMSAVLAGGGPGVIGVLLQGVLDTILRHKDTRSDHYNGDTAEVDLTALIAEITALKDEVTTLQQRFLSTDTVTIADILEMGLIDENAAAEKYSILWNLARQAIRVIVTSGNDLDDVLLDEATS